jgi:hypothetical protein
MLARMATTASIWALVMVATTGTALAQRPPNPGQGPPQFSIERAWNWLIARPGVIIALLIIAVAIGYMIVTRRKSRA